ncbi:hypothetical protein NU08_4551 [Flavobacterium anhuiense]|uniref:Uncharacterized protein n=1 Tax=Flavobacterium anhuiense TaxID=459526 RepID=A0A444VSG7_9FLAO|nr:hypothetical protein NU08_4551 [Flavobacterium anhuiense]
MHHLFYNATPLESTFVKKYLRKSSAVQTSNNYLAKDPIFKMFS